MKEKREILRLSSFPFILREIANKLAKYLRTMHRPTEVLCCHPGQQLGLILPPHTLGLKKPWKQYSNQWYTAITKESLDTPWNDIN